MKIMKIVKVIINGIFIIIIKGYKKLISPLFGNRCRFYPSCSEYALQSFKKYWFFKALFKSVWRILRCNPLSKGGFDPVDKNKKDDLIKKKIVLNNHYHKTITRGEI